MESKIHYETIPSASFPEISDFLLENFFPKEPISRALKLPINQVTRWFPFQLKDCLKQNLSVQAIDSETGKLVGVAVNIVVPKTLKSETDGNEEKGEGRGLLEVLDPEKEDVMVKIAKFLGVLNQVSDSFYESGADANGNLKTFNCIYLATLPNYSGRGIGKRMIEESEKIAKKLPVAFLQVDTTSEFSFRIFHHHCKYDVIKEIDVVPYIPGIENIDNGAHKKGRILLKKL